MSRLTKPGSLILLFILLSLLGHLLFIFFVYIAPFTFKPVATEKPQTVFVELARKPKPIVDIAKPKEEKIPEKPTAEGLYNQRVKEEQVTTQSGPTIINQPKASPKPSSEKTNPKKDKSIPDEKPKPEEPKNAGRANPIPGLPELAPSRLGGEYLPKIKIGNEVYLNVEANPYLPYFIELKRRFSLTWNPRAVLLPQVSRLPSGPISVKMGVVVNRQGELVGLSVITPSNIDGYDQEAMRAIRSSAPFSSPPENLVENGLVKMYWNFRFTR